MRKLRAVAAAVGAVTAILTAGPAGAAPLCVGEHSLAVFCVDPEGSSKTVCIYAGPPPCTPVTIPIPTSWCGGILAVFC